MPNSSVNAHDMAPGWFVGLDSPRFWSPDLAVDRLLSPYPSTNRIRCVGYQVPLECWQADDRGRPHELRAVEYPVGSLGSLTGHLNSRIWVVPGFVPGS